VTKKRTATATMISNVVLSENIGSNHEIIYVPHHRKKRKPAPLPASQPAKVQVVEHVNFLTWKSKLIVKTCPRQATLVTKGRANNMHYICIEDRLKCFHLVLLGN
jgi:hypothetical protein